MGRSGNTSTRYEETGLYQSLFIFTNSHKPNNWAWMLITELKTGKIIYNYINKGLY